MQIVQGRKLLRYAELNCNLLENFGGWTLVLYRQSLWKSFTITDRESVGLYAINVK